MAIDLHKPGDYRISLLKEDYVSTPIEQPISVSTKEWTPDNQSSSWRLKFREECTKKMDELDRRLIYETADPYFYNSLTQQMNLNKAPTVDKNAYYKRGETGIDPTDYFGIDLSDFLVDKQLKENLALWRRTTASDILDKFDENTQEQLAMLFTNQQKFLSRQTEYINSELETAIIKTTLPEYDPMFNPNIKYDINLYIAGLIKTLSKNGNKVKAMKTAKTKERRNDGMYIELNAHPIKFSELKSCKGKEIYMFLPFMYASMNTFDGHELLFIGDIH